MLPTLLRPGFIVPNAKTSKSEKLKIKNTRSIDVITNFISDRIPAVAGGNPKIPPKKPGDKVIVLKSETGSGKSTVLPPSLYENFNMRARGTIAVTQPRVLTAIDITENLPDNYPFLKLDENLGYSTGDYKRLPSEKTSVLFMTTGVIANQLKTMTDEDFMKKYSFILIDEVHDRDLNVDTSLFLLKKLITLHYTKPECPMIILMSATFKPKTFMDYFGCPDDNYIQVVGSTFPIEANFTKYDLDDYLKYAADMAEEIHIKNILDITEKAKSRDIIIFVSGAGPSKDILGRLHAFNTKILSKPFSEVKKYLEDKKSREKQGGDEGDERYYIAPIDLSAKTFNASGAEYQNLFSDIESIMVPLYQVNEKGVADSKTILKWVKPCRRIIIATPIAETGVTIETLKYCIDTGLVNSVQHNPDFAASTIIKKDVTRGMATQRRGRVGRKAPGIWYPCFTEKTFNALQEDQFAEILIKDITQSLLSIFIRETESDIIEYLAITNSEKEIEKLNLFKKNYMTDTSYYHLISQKPLNISSIDFLESPAANSLVYSTEKLYTLGFIDSKYNPTAMGVLANGFNKVSIECIRLIFAGYSHCANILDLITIVSFIEIGREKIFTRKYTPINIFPKKLSPKEYEFFYKIIIGDEMIEYLFIWEMYSELLDEMMKSTKAKSEKGQPYIFDVSSIDDWFVENKLMADGINQVTTMRDEIISSLVSMGLNPYWNGIGLEKGGYNLLNMFRDNLDECVDEIKKIKKCILDGFILNLAVWDNSTKHYILHHRNIPVSVRSNVLSRMGDNAVQTNANFIILSNLSLKQSMMNKDIFQFESMSGSISIMDSYLDIDLGFFNR